VSVVEAAVKFVDRPGLFAVTVHAEIREFGQPVFSPVSRVLYSASFSLFNVYQPHQGLLAIIVITAVTSCGYETDGIGLQEPLSQHLVACRADGERLEENFDVTVLYKLPPEYLAGLSQDSDVILTVLLQVASVVKHLVLMTVVPPHEFTPLGMTHLVRSEN
jgi:hypothetical protein